MDVRVTIGAGEASESYKNASYELPIVKSVSTVPLSGTVGSTAGDVVAVNGTGFGGASHDQRRAE